MNGCGIARDAAGRGLRVLLAEKGDLASATSSASTKLFHGGLRYLEHYEFRLVREALKEREVLLRAMPHISWPMRFVLPHHKGLRPAWLLRLGLFIYDHLGGRKILPATKALKLAKNPVGTPLKPEYTKAFEYSDCWVQDARLVVLNARDAADRGAEILTRTTCIGAEPDNGIWQVTLRSEAEPVERRIRARALVNAAGPWVEEVANGLMRQNSTEKIRLVRGSHIVVRRLFEHDRAYIFQQSDGRIVFAIPYENDFTLIGTTDVDHQGDAGDAECSTAEADYLRAAVSEYFVRPVEADEIVWTYSGVRPLFDDGAGSASEASRDYVLKLTHPGGAPVLNVFGGKITTYRKLAEEAMERLGAIFDVSGAGWTAEAPLPGGDFPVDGFDDLCGQVQARMLGLDPATVSRMVRAYGTQTIHMLGDAASPDDLGRDFGEGLHETELRWLIEKEWARTAEDVLWRRSKLGLRYTREQADGLADWMKTHAVPRNGTQAA